MLPAEKPVSPTADANTPATRSFGKVLNSIQGLQQRLDDFSVEDVTHAQNKTENLIRELSFLQRKLNLLAIIRQRLTDSRRTTSEIPGDNFELAASDTMEMYPTLHMLVKANKLIELVRVRAPSLTKYIDDCVAARESVKVIRLTADPGSIKELPSPLLQVQGIPASQTTGGMRSVVPSESGANEFIPDGLGQLGPTSERADLLPAVMAEASGPDISRSENSNPDFPTEKLAAQPQAAADKMKKPTAGNVDYNARLLEDLISTYGDFTGAPNLSPPRKKPKSGKPKATEHKKSTPNVALGATNIADATRVSTSVTVLSPDSESTKIPEAEIVSLGKAQLPHTAAESVRALTNHSEIDRQLKNIIKNYGEYDLYQLHTSSNLKLAGISAIALLALVLGGFYFFKYPRETAVPINSTAQPGAKPALLSQPSNTIGKSGAGEQPTTRDPNTRQRN